MNALDVSFLILIGISVIYSFIRGLVREIFSLLAIILGFLGASYGYAILAVWLKKWVENETLALVLGFAILFLAIAFSLSLAGKLLSNFIKSMDLSWADRVGGGAFGLLKAILLIAVIILVLTAFLPAKSKILRESVISPSVMTIARGLSWVVPEKLHGLYEEREKELKKFWATQELSAGGGEIKGGKKR